MKKVFALGSSLALVFTLVSCGGGSSVPNEDAYVFGASLMSLSSDIMTDIKEGVIDLSSINLNEANINELKTGTFNCTPGGTVTISGNYTDYNNPIDADGNRTDGDGEATLTYNECQFIETQLCTTPITTSFKTGELTFNWINTSYFPAGSTIPDDYHYMSSTITGTITIATVSPTESSSSCDINLVLARTGWSLLQDPEQSMANLTGTICGDDITTIENLLVVDVCEAIEQ